MNKPIIIVMGEPYSIFSEILFKSFNKLKKKNSKHILLIGSVELIKKQMLKLNYNIKINEIYDHNFPNKYLKKSSLNIIDVSFNFKKTFDKISFKSKDYIYKSFEKALYLIKKKRGIGLINGPISKIHFLNKSTPGITEYLSRKCKIKNDGVMLIYNSKISVSPLTTHIPIKKVHTKINKNKIINNVKIISNFYKNYLKKKPLIAVLGLNPHCETNDKVNEEKKIITPSIKLLKKMNFNIHGPFSADTFFLKKNIDHFDVVLGMYHDQVITPLKTLYNFDAVNITLGLPFIRISPDHGPNNMMIGKNKSDPDSLISAINFLSKIK